jgi:hypothetical protein
VLNAAQKTFLRLCLIPIGTAIGFGWAADGQEVWGVYLLWAGIISGLFVIPILTRRR